MKKKLATLTFLACLSGQFLLGWGSCISIARNVLDEYANDDQGWAEELGEDIDDFLDNF
jgi:hypothetical protein